MRHTVYWKIGTDKFFVLSCNKIIFIWLINFTFNSWSSVRYNFFKITILNASVRYTVEWIGRDGLAPETHGEYLQNFIAHFYRNIARLVDRAMRKEDSSPQGQIVTEILQHLHACNNSVKVQRLIK